MELDSAELKRVSTGSMHTVALPTVMLKHRIHGIFSKQICQSAVATGGFSRFVVFVSRYLPRDWLGRTSPK